MAFEKTWQYYDALYAADGKDYAAEAKLLRWMAADHGAEPGNARWLDVACGTGRHFEHLSGFERVGTDIDPRMLQIAQERCHDVRFEAMDMRTLDAAQLGGTFDVVTCLFSAIGYMANKEDLQAAVRSMADCLATTGVLLIEPFIEPGMVEALDRPRATFVDMPALKLARINYASVREGNRLAIEFHYLIGEGGEVRHVRESHELTMFEREDFREAYEMAGLNWSYKENGIAGRGLHLGTR